MTLFPGIANVDKPVDLARWLERAMVAVVVLACATVLSANVADPDLWGHVQYGRDALAHGLPRTTTYSYVAEGYRWINHEILAEYALAIGADRLGGSGLLVVKCLLGLAVVGAILWRSFRQGASTIAACTMALLVAFALASHWTLRPQLFSYVGFTLLVALLSYCFEGWEGKWQLERMRTTVASILSSRYPALSTRFLAASDSDLNPKSKIQNLKSDSTPHSALRSPHSHSLIYSVPRLKFLWLVPLLMAVWTNSHGGFLAGLCVYLAYLGLRGIEAFAHKGSAARGLLLRFGLMGLAAITATFLNPYGPLFHLWLYDDLAVPRPEIVEWRAPELFDLQFLPLWLLIGVGLASLVFSRRSRDFTQVVILGLVLWQVLEHHRHSAFFAIACGWWLPLHLDSLLERLGVGRQVKTEPELRYGWAPPESQGLAAGFSPRAQQVMALLLVGVVCLCSFQLARRLSTLQVDRSRYPVDAVDFIARRGLTGKMVCTFNWGQYALAAVGAREPGQPGIQIQIDGRCRTSYSQEMLDMHFDFILGDVGPDQRYRDSRSGPFNPERVLHFEHPDLVLISRLQEPSALVMKKQQGEWVLLYQDALAQLWGRASRYDDPKSCYYLPPAKREIGSFVPRGFVRWPALPAYRPALEVEPASAPGQDPAAGTNAASMVRT